MTWSNRHPRGVLVGAAAAGLVISAVTATHPGSAARLELRDAGVAQYWELSVVPPTTPSVDLTACGDLAQYDDIVYGTDGPDELTGGNGPQVLVGLGGDDVLRGGNQDDCLVGGEGNDELYGGNGQDILVGGLGDDLLDGGTGRDTVIGGGQAGDRCTTRPGVPDTTAGTCGSPDVDDARRVVVGTDAEKAPGPAPAGQARPQPTNQPLREASATASS